MVSRRKILSRSRDDLHMEAPPDEEDVWYQKEKLFKVQPPKKHFTLSVATQDAFAQHCVAYTRLRHALDTK